jgi:hypothetical protein
MKRDRARKLLALARANREVACAVEERTREHLKEVQKTVEMLREQETVAKARVKIAYQRIGALRAALTRLGIPEISLSDNEGDNGGNIDDNGDPEMGEDCVETLYWDDMD